MALEKRIEFLCEFDGTGAPTGTCWHDGVKCSFSTSTAPASLRMPVSTGKTTDKFAVSLTAFISYTVTDGAIKTFTIKHPNGNTLATWASTSYGRE